MFKMVKVSDEWFPNFNGDEVMVSIWGNTVEGYTVTVCGEDDYDVNSDYKDLEDALECYKAITLKGIIDYAYVVRCMRKGTIR
jgi:hypothetical protein